MQNRFNALGQSVPYTAEDMAEQLSEADLRIRTRPPGARVPGGPDCPSPYRKVGG